MNFADILNEPEEEPSTGLNFADILTESDAEETKPVMSFASILAEEEQTKTPVAPAISFASILAEEEQPDKSAFIALQKKLGLDKFNPPNGLPPPVAGPVVPDLRTQNWQQPEPHKEPSTAAGSFARAAQTQIGPVVAGYLGGRGAVATGPKLVETAIKLGTKVPGGPIAKIAGVTTLGLIGMFGGSYLGNKLQQLVEEKAYGPEGYQELERKRQQDLTEHPVAVGLGSLIPQAVLSGPNAKPAIRTVAMIGKMAKNPNYITSQQGIEDLTAAANVLIGAGTPTANAIIQKIRGKDVDVISTMIQAIGGAFLTKDTPVTKALNKITFKANTTPQKLASDIEKVQHNLRPASGESSIDLLTRTLEAREKPGLFERGQQIMAKERGAFPPEPSAIINQFRPEEFQQPEVAARLQRFADKTKEPPAPPSSRTVTPEDIYPIRAVDRVARNLKLIGVKMRQFADKFTATSGLPKIAKDALVQQQNDVEALSIGNRETKIAMNGLKRDMIRSGMTREQADAAIAKTINGEQTIDEFANSIGAKEGNRGIAALRAFETTKASAVSNVARYLRGIGKESLAEVIENNPNYITRYYGLFEKTGFAPSNEARQKATTLVYNELLKQQGTQSDLLPKDANLVDVANSMIEEILNPAKRGVGSSVPVNNLKRRTLEPVFRDLFGEVKDPVNNMLRTAETQGRLLANFALMDKLTDAGSDISSPLPAQEKGLTIALPKNPEKYGNLAGRYVSPNLAYFLKVQNETPNIVAKIYREILSDWRVAKLLNPISAGRNILTSLTGHGMQTGEALDPRYLNEFGKAVKLMTQYAAGNKQAIDTVKRYAQTGVARMGGTASADDIMAWTSPMGLAKAKKTGMKVYSAMDFAAHVASYNYQTKNGMKITGGKNPMSHEEAIQWLDNYYQRSSETPIIAQQLSRNTPFTDFIGYTAQTIRMQKNAIRLGLASLREGNPVPLLGFLVSHGIAVAALTKTEETLKTVVWPFIRSKFKGDNPEKVSRESNAALGDFMPPYWKTSTKLSWVRRNKEGAPVLSTAILAGTHAWPMDDVVAGLYAYIRDNKVPNEEVAMQAVDAAYRTIFSPNMLVSEASKTLLGKSLDSNQRDQKGLVDVLKLGPPFGLDDVEGRKVFTDALLNVGSQFIPKGQQLRQLYQAKQREKAGQTPTSGQKTSEEIKQNLMSFVRVESYDKPRALDAILYAVQKVAEAGEIVSLAESKALIGREERAIREQGAATSLQTERAIASEERRMKTLNKMRHVISQARIAFKPLGITDADMMQTLQGKIKGLGRESGELAYVFGVADKTQPRRR